MTPTVQCEACDEMVPERECVTETYPGATLAFCQECAKPTRAEELGLSP